MRVARRLTHSPKRHLRRLNDIGRSRVLELVRRDDDDALRQDEAHLPQELELIAGQIVHIAGQKIRFELAEFGHVEASHLGPRQKPRNSEPRGTPPRDSCRRCSSAISCSALANAAAGRIGPTSDAAYTGAGAVPQGLRRRRAACLSRRRHQSSAEQACRNCQKRAAIQREN
jgi:hypothetical protein